jgi:hypothetical protein
MSVSFESSALASPSTSVVIGSDTIGGIDYQRVKVVWGTTGTATELTTLAGLPVQVMASSSTTTPQGTVQLSSGTAFIGDISAPIETTFFSSGTLIAPVKASITTSSSFALIFTGATATQTNRIISAIFSRSSSTEVIYGAQLMTSAAVALTAKIFMSPTPSNTVTLPFNPAGWADTTTTAVYYQTGVLLSTSAAVSVTYLPL